MIADKEEGSGLIGGWIAEIHWLDLKRLSRYGARSCEEVLPYVSCGVPNGLVETDSDIWSKMEGRGFKKCREVAVSKGNTNMNEVMGVRTN